MVDGVDVRSCLQRGEGQNRAACARHLVKDLDHLSVPQHRRDLGLIKNEKRVGEAEARRVERRGGEERRRGGGEGRRG
eukprot:745907-Hanusia_phi.AAC.2